MKKLIVILMTCILIAAMLFIMGCDEELPLPGGSEGSSDDDRSNGNSGNVEDKDNEPEHTHDFGEWFIVTEATCTKKGTKRRVCSCNEAEEMEIPAFGHTEVTDDAKAATCTGAGLTEGKHCSVCNAVLVKQETVAAKGHSYKDGICENCKQPQPVSEGLQFSLNSDKESYSVTGIGDCLDKDILIPSTYNDKPVTNIEVNAFYGCSRLTSITIPNSVMSIGDFAFWHCSALTSVTIPDSVTSIGYSAFRNCSILTSVTIGDGVTSIGGDAFYGCSSLASIKIPDSVTRIGDDAFSGTAYYNDETNWENGVLYIGKHLIVANTSISGSYTIKDGALCIAGDAFSGCSSLTSITIPNSVTSIGNRVFSGCSSLESMIVAEGNSKYHSTGNCLIETESKKLILGCKNSVMPDDGSVTSIGAYAFV